MVLDERGKACPLPVIETKKALESGVSGEIFEVWVDNEIAVQNLKKMALHKGLNVEWEQREAQLYAVKIQIPGERTLVEEKTCSSCRIQAGTVVVISSGEMGNGDPVLGRLLIKSFLYALSKQDLLPETILLYNGGAYLSCEGSESLEDLKSMEAEGTEIFTCGTCLNHYGIGDKLCVGSVSNMYEIVERMTGATLLVRP